MEIEARFKNMNIGSASSNSVPINQPIGGPVYQPSGTYPPASYQESFLFKANASKDYKEDFLLKATTALEYYNSSHGVGGTILAAKLAKERGWAINVGGGFHHCCANRGGGFCAYADISLCIHYAFIRLNISRSFLDTQYTYQLSKLKLKLRSGLMTVTFQKCLCVSLAERSNFSEGEIQTFMSVDTDRTVNLCNSFHDMWSLPLQIGVALYLLYTQVKFAFLSGLTITILLILVNKWIAELIASATKNMMEQKDERLSNGC